MLELPQTALKPELLQLPFKSRSPASRSPIPPPTASRRRRTSTPRWWHWNVCPFFTNA